MAHDTGDVIILGTLAIGPWAFLILYDILLYVWRASTYEIPIIGGRARGRQRPQAPSFSERPSGRRRTFSLRGAAYDYDEAGDGDDSSTGEETPDDENGVGSGSGSENGNGNAQEARYDPDAEFFGKHDQVVGDGLRSRKIYAEPDGIGTGLED
ncbi:hypothetical protein FQN55_004445 [Onygenales sp. PD_40]|nr:hypothetical protein FQN55_004445 [Onygenales sp. PD_40]KAK2786249.1 hypothetical protein FQN53_006803 [Emmonsiellopsis sp. PD_33]